MRSFRISESLDCVTPSASDIAPLVATVLAETKAFTANINRLFMSAFSIYSENSLQKVCNIFGISEFLYLLCTVLHLGNGLNV